MAKVLKLHHWKWRRLFAEHRNAALAGLAVGLIGALALGLVSGRANSSPSSPPGPASAGFSEHDLNAVDVSVLPTEASQFSCDDPYIIDGDTLSCGNRRIRLAGIDTPEMPGHCRPGRDCTPGDPFKAKRALEALTVGPLTCEDRGLDSYGRTLALCWSGTENLSCAMIEGGHAVARYDVIDCPG